MKADTRSNKDAPKSNLGCRPRYVNRRFRHGYLRAGGPTRAALCRNQSTLRTGGICAGRCQDRRRSFCGLHRADHTANGATASGEQAFATDRLTARCRLQSAESELRPAYRNAVASGSATRAVEPAPKSCAAAAQCAAIANSRAPHEPSQPCRESPGSCARMRLTSASKHHPMLGG